MERHFHTILFFKTIKFSTLKVDMTFQTHQMNGQEQLVTKYVARGEKHGNE